MKESHSLATVLAACLVALGPAESVRAQSSCCIAHTGPGCDSPQCQQAVCALLPHCCQLSWDLGCVNLAQNVCGPLCTGGGPITDYLETCPTIDPLANSIHFGSPAVPPIPANFFAPGSDPFQGIITYVGEPLDPFGPFGLADTLVQRPSDPIQLFEPPGTSHFVPIELVALSLVSFDPITVTFNGGQNAQPWDLRIDLSVVQEPGGGLQATKQHPNGGTFTSQFFVQPRFTFTKVDDPSQVRVLDTGQIPLPPIHFESAAAPWVHNANPGLNIILPGPNSQWVPGILETVPGQIDSQVISPFTTVSLPQGVVHTVCPAPAKEGRCEVTSKTMPQGQLGCTNVPGPNNTRKITAEFDMIARFRDNCACCEYRQYVKGEFKLKGQHVAHPLVPGDPLDKNMFKEDGFGAPTPPGNNPRYGHRQQEKNPNGDRYKNPASRKTGCNYEGKDGPGFKDARPGIAYSISLTFRGQILDACNELTLLPIHEWTVECSGNALGTDPQPLAEVEIETTINGRLAILGVYRYPGNVLTVVGSISNFAGDPSMDASEVNISVQGLAAIAAPEPGPLPQSITAGASAHAMYDFDYPPGSPGTVHVTFTYGPETQEFDVPIGAPCPADLDGDGTVGVIDFLMLLGGWGPCLGCPPACPGDIDGDCTVGVIDFLALLGAWGPC